MRTYIWILILPVIIAGCFFSGSKGDKISVAQKEYLKGNKREFDKILETFKAQTPESPRAAITLGKLGNRAAVPALAAEVLANGQSAREAMIALDMIKDPRIAPLLIRLINLKHAFARDAVQLLGELRSKEGVDVLNKVVNEKRPYYMDAVIALGKIGDSRSVPHLMELLKTPAPDVSENVRFRLIHKDKTDKDWEHIKTFSLPENLPPKIEIQSFQFDPIGTAYIRYQLYDAELDTVFLTVEYSIDNGRNWQPAATEGKINFITSRDYAGLIRWHSLLDSIPAKRNVQLVFKIIPSDKPGSGEHGVPAIVPINRDITPLEVQTMDIEYSENIAIPFYYPGTVGREEDRFAYQYSLNSGKTWMRANAAPFIPRGGSPPDTQWVLWKSAEDLPGFDSPNTIFLVSSSKGRTLGSFNQSKPIHLDNNAPPSIALSGISEDELLNIHYNISDVEQDTVGLMITFSLDRGFSWEYATMSGDLSRIGPDRYTGRLRWYDDFDIPGVHDEPIRLRITPYDNDMGEPGDTPIFFLKDMNFAKLTQGDQSGNIEVKYYYSQVDSSLPIGQYSVDGGKTWQDASISTTAPIQQNGKQQRKVNWNFDQDVPIAGARVDMIAQALSQIQDSTIIPQLIILSLQKEHPNRAIRLRGIQAHRILDSQEGWVVAGLIKSLWYPQNVVHQTAAAILSDVDDPNIRLAVNDYYLYWAQVRETQHEFASAEDESKFYASAIDRLRKRKPTYEELVGFVETMGMSTLKAKEFLSHLDAFREEKPLRQLYMSGKITEEEYDRRLGIILRKLEARRIREEKELEQNQ